MSSEVNVQDVFRMSIDGELPPSEIVYPGAPIGEDARVGGMTIQSDGLTYRIRSHRAGAWDALVPYDTLLELVKVS